MAAGTATLEFRGARILALLTCGRAWTIGGLIARGLDGEQPRASIGETLLWKSGMQLLDRRSTATRRASALGEVIAGSGSGARGGGTIDVAGLGNCLGNAGADKVAFCGIATGA